jgi:hypothetical protein
MMQSPSRKAFLSLYQGPFDFIGPQLAELTGDFADFNIISNVPYGLQSQVHQKMNLQQTYRSFGNFLSFYPNLLRNGSYIVA